MATSPKLAKSSASGFPWGRLWFLLGALVVFRVGAHIPVPGIDPVQLAALFNQNRGGILGMFNMFSGGALSRFTIFALGIMPYISASIIMQLLSVVSPQLEALKKEGESGRRKITQYTRYGTLVLATFQALGIAVALEAQRGLVIDPGLAFRAGKQQSAQAWRCGCGYRPAHRAGRQTAPPLSRPRLRSRPVPGPWPGADSAHTSAAAHLRGRGLSRSRLDRPRRSWRSVRPSRHGPR